jgi:hypothetical protein
MYTVTYTNTDGNVMKLLLTDTEFERGLHRAQENAGDLNINQWLNENLINLI